MERITGSETMLNIASSMSGTTSAEGTEDMTLSMITGNDPAFSTHINQLTDWIKSSKTPDIIHLSSTLLIGIAKVLRQQLNIPIVCSVQDEEVWIDSLNSFHSDKAWQGIAENIGYIESFITTSEFYKNIAHKKIPGIKSIEVIYPGVDRKKYASTGYPEFPTIGFFYRMNKENGLNILAEAFVRLKKQNIIPHLKLKIGGGYTGKDKAFLKKIKKTLEPYREDIEICEDYNLENHAGFYNSVSVISVPLTFEEGVGLYLCEAFAAGRPAVEPATGSFPEIVGEAGILYEPNSSEALANTLLKLLNNTELYTRTAEKARELSESRYNEKVLAEKLISTYKKIVVSGK